MDPTALATFMAVARHRSVTAAALELHTVQSNVTARIRQLEGDLDVEWFAAPCVSAPWRPRPR